MTNYLLTGVELPPALRAKVKMWGWTTTLGGEGEVPLTLK